VTKPNKDTEVPIGSTTENYQIVDHQSSLADKDDSTVMKNRLSCSK